MKKTMSMVLESKTVVYYDELVNVKAKTFRYDEGTRGFEITFKGHTEDEANKLIEAFKDTVNQEYEAWLSGCPSVITSDGLIEYTNVLLVIVDMYGDYEVEKTSISDIKKLWSKFKSVCSQKVKN
jgi:hypothetical protein